MFSLSQLSISEQTNNTLSLEKSTVYVISKILFSLFQGRQNHVVRLSTSVLLSRKP